MSRNFEQKHLNVDIYLNYQVFGNSYQFATNQQLHYLTVEVKHEMMLIYHGHKYQFFNKCSNLQLF